ncbi:MAG: DUF4302 domain-containing protein [Candidatus Pseudobacter hemicellulosilyticus]|uniref:DUF4302 domain-containing protein n=1 Tax=Candidatus Pseudobacter hemicellulosilyticus TaxID=3121375 RepID=A0AAJ6BHI1_9BACT|nr:MAG: DUF4302 domain-containing protein [Pseudobacter sp.]
MKKHLFYILCLMAVLASCKKDSTRVFEEKADVRVGKTLTAFQQALTAAPNGWKAVLYPKGGGGYSFWMKFNNENRVTMVSDFDDETSTQVKSSSYRLKSLQQPVLIFDTYSYIHLLADPTPSISGGGNDGRGLSSDFEFMLLEGLIDSLSKGLPIDKMSLTGRFNGVVISLTKATAAEETAYQNGELFDLMLPVAQYVSTNTYLFLNIGDEKKLQVSLDPGRKNFSLGWEIGGVVYSSNSPFAFTLNGIQLQKPVEYNGKSFSEMFWDDAAQELYINLDGKRTVVQVSPTPILPLHLVIGTTGFSSILLPAAGTFPGWSTDFSTRRSAAAASMLAGPYRLTMGRMEFEFNSSLKTMTIWLEIFQGTAGFIATFSYTYTKTQAGEFKFTPADPAANGNGALIITDMAPLLTQRINADHFVLEYLNDVNEGNLGVIKSVEHSDFSLSGYFL